MATKRMHARVHPTYGVIHRDFTLHQEHAMFKKYGHNWKKKLKRMAEELAKNDPANEERGRE